MFNHVSEVQGSGTRMRFRVTGTARFKAKPQELVNVGCNIS
jgi:hypothetical protein